MCPDLSRLRRQSRKMKPQSTQRPHRILRNHPVLWGLLICLILGIPLYQVFASSWRTSMTTSTVTTSVRVAALQRAIADGEPNALGAFWQDVAALGTPLVEPGATLEERIVTFLWRGPASDVQLVCPLTGHGRA